jgi:hypothetical protein
LSPFEQNGRWNRDVLPCYPDDLNGDGKPDSASTVSRDSYIMLLHHWLSYGDKDAVNRAVQYASDNNYTVGDGPWDYVNISPLMLFMWDLQDRMNGADNKIELVDFDAQFQGFRGYLMAMTIWYLARFNGEVGTWGMMGLEKLVKEEPENPLFNALLNRYTTGDQSKVIDFINKTFDPNVVPTGDGDFGWGSCPNAIYMILLTSILEGK